MTKYEEIRAKVAHQFNERIKELELENLRLKEQNMTLKKEKLALENDKLVLENKLQKADPNNAMKKFNEMLSIYDNLDTFIK